MVAPMKLNSMTESGGRDGVDTMLTGTNDGTDFGLPLASRPYFVIHRRSRFALMPCAKAVLATDTPGRWHISTSACFADLLYVRRPLAGARTTSPSTSSTLFSVMVSTKKLVDTILR